MKAHHLALLGLLSGCVIAPTSITANTNIEGAVNTQATVVADANVNTQGSMSAQQSTSTSVNVAAQATQTNNVDITQQAQVVVGANNQATQVNSQPTGPGASRTPDPQPAPTASAGQARTPEPSSSPSPVNDQTGRFFPSPTPTPTPTATAAPSPTPTANVTYNDSVAITLYGGKMNPDVANIKRGGTIMFIGKDAPGFNGHIFVSDESSPAQFKSNQISSEGEQVQVQLSVSGTYHYHCDHHSSEIGTINVGP